jgi:hypothetical protein
MITHFRGILADTFEPGDLLEGEIANDPEGDHGALPRRQAGDEVCQPVAKPPGDGHILDLREVTLWHLVERNGPLATPGSV